DETLRVLRHCFENDVVELHGQPILFQPRPPRPPIYVGGWPPHALGRAIRYGDGWIPTAIETGSPEACNRAIAGAVPSRGATGARGDRNEDAAARGSPPSGRLCAAVSRRRGHAPRPHPGVRK